MKGNLTTENGVLQDAEGCDVMDRHGQKIQIQDGEKPDGSGCFRNGQCLAVIDPKSGNFEILDKDTLKGTGNPLDLLVPVEEGFVEEGRLRIWEEGLVGADFSKVSVLPPPSCD